MRLVSRSGWRSWSFNWRCCSRAVRGGRARRIGLRAFAPSGMARIKRATPGYARGQEIEAEVRGSRKPRETRGSKTQDILSRALEIESAGIPGGYGKRACTGAWSRAVALNRIPPNFDNCGNRTQGTRHFRARNGVPLERCTRPVLNSLRSSIPVWLGLRDLLFCDCNCYRHSGALVSKSGASQLGGLDQGPPR
jgi:hypothetical protein